MLDMLAVVARKDYDDRCRIEKAKSEGKYSGRQQNLKWLCCQFNEA